MLRAVRTMRSGRGAVVAAVLLAFAVLLMHTGMPPMAMPTASAAVPSHHGTHRATVADGPVIERADQRAQVQKQSMDAVHQHEAHDCAGTVVVHKAVGAPPLVAVLPLADGDTDTTASTGAARARAPPPWTVLGLAELCILRL